MQTIVFDTETTGLLKPDVVDISQQPKIIELYACKLDEDFNLIGEFDVLLNPGHNLSSNITKITGITDEDLADAVSFPDIYHDLADFFLGVKRVVAHNLAFDIGMLKNELARIDCVTKFPWPPEHICTVERSIHIKGFRLNLQRLHQELLEYGFKDAHRAKEDVFALVRCYHALCERGDID